MIRPRFSLKNKKSVNPTLINLILNYHGKRFKISTGHSVPVKYWNHTVERVKENHEFSDFNSINRDLDRQFTALKKAFEFFNDNHISPNVEELKLKYFEFILHPKHNVNQKTLWDYFDEFIEYQKGKILLKSVMDYDKALRKHLKNTETLFKISLTFSALKSSGNFIQNLELYLTKHAVNADGKKGFSLNAKGKQMKNVKAFLNWCFMKEYCPPFSLKHIVKYSEEVDNIYLTVEEIDRLYSLKELSMDEEHTRDLFIVGCETGLRFSDFVRIKNEHIDNNYISLFQAKVKSKVTVPISSKLKLILEKYHYNLPQRSNKDLTDFNIQIRNLAALAEINNSIVIQQTRGINREEKFYKKYELISSHTCRRSFCTNKFLKGIPVKVIMAVSGHKTEKAFMKYIKLNNEEIVKAFSEMFD
jgi:integrase